MASSKANQKKTKKACTALKHLGISAIKVRLALNASWRLMRTIGRISRQRIIGCLLDAIFELEETMVLDKPKLIHFLNNEHLRFDNEEPDFNLLHKPDEEEIEPLRKKPRSQNWPSSPAGSSVPCSNNYASEIQKVEPDFGAMDVLEPDKPKLIHFYRRRVSNMVATKSGSNFENSSPDTTICVVNLTLCLKDDSLQRGIRANLQVFTTAEGKRWGLRTLEDLPKGTFVCDYVGEIVTNTRLFERNEQNTDEKHTYPVLLDADWSSGSFLEEDERARALCMVDTNNVDASMVDAAKVKAQVRNKRTWTAEEDQKLIEALMVLHASGKYGAENGFKPGYNQAVQNLLDISIPNSGLKADPHIKSRLKTWRTKFSIMHDMVFGSNTSGFGWDTEKCVLTAPDDVWDSYLKTHPEATKFRNKAFPLFDKLSTVFGKDRASGSRAIDLGDDEVVSEAHQTAPTDLEDEDIDRCVRPSPQGVDGKSKKRKRSKSDEFAHMYSESCTMLNNSITTMGNEMNMNLSKMANDNERKLESEIELMKKVQNEIDALPGITFEEAFEATYVIGKCPLKAEMLFGYDQGKKIRMVKMVARKSTS
ncbi:RNA-binding protein Lupus La [Tanacetum coccineum]